MKSINFLSIVLISALLVLGACNKYEEGPAFSLRTKKARLAEVWEIEKFVSVDGVISYPSEAESGTIEYTKDNKVNATLPVFGFQIIISGEWEFIKDKEWIRTTLEFNGEAQVEESKIIKLKNDELWLEDINGDQTHLIPA